MIGPLLFTQVFAMAIAPQVKVHIPGAPFFVAALLMLASVGVAYVVSRPGASVEAHAVPQAQD